MPYSFINQEIDQVFEDVGLGELSSEQKIILKEQIRERIVRATLEAVLSQLNPEQLQKFKEIIDSGTDIEDAVAGFVIENPGLSPIINLAIQNEWKDLFELLKKAGGGQ